MCIKFNKMNNKEQQNVFAVIFSDSFRSQSRFNKQNDIE